MFPSIVSFSVTSLDTILLGTIFLGTIGFGAGVFGTVCLNAVVFNAVFLSAAGLAGRILSLFCGIFRGVPRLYLGRLLGGGLLTLGAGLIILGGVLGRGGGVVELNQGRVHRRRQRILILRRGTFSFLDRGCFLRLERLIIVEGGKRNSCRVCGNICCGIHRRGGGNVRCLNARAEHPLTLIHERLSVIVLSRLGCPAAALGRLVTAHNVIGGGAGCRIRLLLLRRNTFRRGGQRHNIVGARTAEGGPLPLLPLARVCLLFLNLIGGARGGVFCGVLCRTAGFLSCRRGALSGTLGVLCGLRVVFGLFLLRLNLNEPLGVEVFVHLNTDVLTGCTLV